MIAYKVFRVKNGRLYPFWVHSEFQHYSKGFIYTRADSCGPFACFVEIWSANRMRDRWKEIKTVIHKVRIKKSTNVKMWIHDAKKNGWNNHSSPSWIGTVLADEFEILERIK